MGMALQKWYPQFQVLKGQRNFQGASGTGTPDLWRTGASVSFSWTNTAEQLYVLGREWGAPGDATVGWAGLNALGAQRRESRWGQYPLCRNVGTHREGTSLRPGMSGPSSSKTQRASQSCAESGPGDRRGRGERSHTADTCSGLFPLRSSQEAALSRSPLWVWTLGREGGNAAAAPWTLSPPSFSSPALLLYSSSLSHATPFPSRFSAPICPINCAETCHKGSLNQGFMMTAECLNWWAKCSK